MSYNIRCASCEPPESPNHWSRRASLVAAMIRKHQPDVIALQEAERLALDDLARLLDDYAWTGVGRDDGRDKGEFAAILFRRARFELLEAKTLWLSETPTQVSVGWDAALPRTLGIAVLRDRRSGRKLQVFNTHFDHRGEHAREQSSRLVAREIAARSARKPFILLGDFNFNFSADAEAYAILGAAMRDAETVSRTPPEGGRITFNAFDRSARGTKIDFVFVGADAEVRSHRIDAGDPSGPLASDHHPIIVEVEWR
jgi:endonuclease/exonuclease/phosphatase family metal-dependent hydrolase